LPIEMKFQSLRSKWRVNMVRNRKLPDIVRVYFSGNKENKNIRQIIEMSRWWLGEEGCVLAHSLLYIIGERSMM
jgi:hypothetical protein